MDIILTIVLVCSALFVAFLMLTSGRHRHRLEQKLSELEAERLRLMKTIEHIKISFYKKKIGEKEAQDKIFEYEEKIRLMDAKILQIKEKPLIRTLQKQEAYDKTRANDKSLSSDPVEIEEIEIKSAEKKVLESIGSNGIFLILIVIAVIAVIGVIIANGVETNEETWELVHIDLQMSASVVPEFGTPPGGSAGLRVEVVNTHNEMIEDIVLVANAPEGSGIFFTDPQGTDPTFESETVVIDIGDMLPGEIREPFLGVQTSPDTVEGTYTLTAKISDSRYLNSTAEGKLIVSYVTTNEE